MCMCVCERDLFHLCGKSNVISTSFICISMKLVHGPHSFLRKKFTCNHQITPNQQRRSLISTLKENKDQFQVLVSFAPTSDLVCSSVRNVLFFKDAEKSLQRGGVSWRHL